MRSRTLIAKAWIGVLLLLLGAASAAGCDNDPVSPTSPALARQEATNYGGVGFSNGSLTAATIEAMNRAIQDEYHAEFVYLKVIETFGEVQPFANILFAEQRHSEAIAQLFANHGLAVPASDWNLGNVPSFASLAAACAAAATTERENIAMYDELLALDLPTDVRNVFTNLRLASLENHLPAFQTCCACGL